MEKFVVKAFNGLYFAGNKSHLRISYTNNINSAYGYLSQKRAETCAKKLEGEVIRLVFNPDKKIYEKV